MQVLDTDKIFADFPDAHIVHIVRNPWSGYADTCKRPFPISLKRYAWTWNYCQHLALTYQQVYPDRIHVIRFEDLIADREATMAGLLKKIELPMSEKCLAPSFNGVILEEVYPWGTIRIPTPDTNLKTAHELSQMQQAQIEAETVVMRTLLKYQNFL